MDWVAGVGQWNASLLLLACCKTLCYQLAEAISPQGTCVFERADGALETLARALGVLPAVCAESFQRCSPLRRHV